MARAARIAPPLALAALLAGCGGGGDSTTTNACTDPASPRYTVTGTGLILASVPGAGGATLGSFQLRLVEPVRLSTGGGVAGATLGGPVTLGSAWAVSGVNPACSSVGVLSATYAPGEEDFVVLSGAIETSAFPPGTTTAVATGPAFALPRVSVNSLATAAGITVSGSPARPAEPFTVVWLQPAYNGTGGKTIGLVDAVGAAVTRYSIAYLDDSFTGTQATTAAHGLAVMRKVDPTVLIPVQLEPRTGIVNTSPSPVCSATVTDGCALPRCSATVTAGCWDPNASQASVLPGAAFVAPVKILP